MASQTLLVLMLLFVTVAAASVTEIQWDLNNQVQKLSIPLGDSVQFNYQSGIHDVVGVSNTDFNSCETSVIIAYYNGGNSVVSFESTGTYWFICSIENHCSTYGMRVAITVY